MYSEFSEYTYSGENLEVVSLQVKRGERGSTFYINIPKKIVAKLRWRQGDKLALVAQDDCLFIKRIEIRIPKNEPP